MLFVIPWPTASGFETKECILNPISLKMPRHHCNMAGMVEQTRGYNFSIKGKTKFQLVNPGAQLSIFKEVLNGYDISFVEGIFQILLVM